MSARITRTRALGAIWLFALIVTAWASVSAQESHACTVDPCSTDPTVVCDYYGQQGCTFGEEVAVGTANGEVAEAVGAANNAPAMPGVSPCVGSTCAPSLAGVPLAEGGGTYEVMTNSRLQDNKACVALDSAASSLSGSQRALALGHPCGDNNEYHCWSIYIGTGRKYSPGIYWDWMTHMDWCGYSIGKITSRTYNDHYGLAMGYQCSLKKEQRTPVEKIDGGHWQQHSNFTFECRASTFFKEDHPQEGAHYYSNGYYKKIEKTA